jgi:hypothetical protein
VVGHKALYCATHKKDGMIDVVHKTCFHEECKKQPKFNAVGEKNGLYCSAHKREGMVDVLNKTCIHPECKTHPKFNAVGEKNGLYCSAHKKDGMINVADKTCIHEGCETLPTFNIKGQKALYCSAHKKDGMINVVNKTCIHEGCEKQPKFNIKGQKNGLYCSFHKTDGMINVVDKTCIHEGCETLPYFNIEGEKTGLYCSAHKREGMIDIKHKTCKSEWCSTQVQKKYDGYCLFCYMNMFPDKPVSRNYKTKEYSVVEYVKTQFPNLNWVADKIVNGGCSKRRPDLLLDLGDQVIIVEVDENQHTDYDCSCENKRTMELSQDVGHRPIVFIRFNPDDYKQDGENITSCWGQNQKGVCVVRKSKKDEWTQRLKTLEEQIYYWVNPSNMTNKTVEIIQLFYDV